MSNPSTQYRELSLTLIQALYRVSRLGIYHSIDNKAFIAAASQLCATVRELLGISENAARILFLERSILVGTQYLKAPRAVYDSAMEVKRMLEGLGGNEICFEHPINVNEVAMLVSCFDTGTISLPDGITIRNIDLSMFDGKLAGESPEDLAVRQYASAIVVLRRLFESLKDGEYVLLQHLKRISQSVLVLAKDHTIQKLGIQSCRNLSYDEAGRAVSRAILVVAVLRHLTANREILSLAAMSALLLDAGRPRVAGLGKPMPEGAVRAIPRLSEKDQARLAASTGVVLIALGRLHDKSLQRLVIAYETQRCRSVGNPNLVHEDGRPISTVALIIALVSEFIELLRFDQRTQHQRTPEDAVGAMRARATTDHERAVVDLLAGVLKIFPMGTGVELATGWQGVVLGPSDGEDPLAPRVRIVCDPTGRPVGPFDVDLSSNAGEAYGWIFRALRTDQNDPLKPEKDRVVRESADFPAVTTAKRLAVPSIGSMDDTVPDRTARPASQGGRERPTDDTLEKIIQDVLGTLRQGPGSVGTEADREILLEQFRNELHDLPTRVLTHGRVKELLEQFLSDRVHRAIEGPIAAPSPSYSLPPDQGPTTTQRLAQRQVDTLLEGFLEGPSPSGLVGRQSAETPRENIVVPKESPEQRAPTPIGTVSVAEEIFDISGDALAETMDGESAAESGDAPPKPKEKTETVMNQAEEEQTDLLPLQKVDQLLDGYEETGPRPVARKTTPFGGEAGVSEEEED